MWLLFGGFSPLLTASAGCFHSLASGLFEQLSFNNSLTTALRRAALACISV